MVHYWDNWDTTPQHSVFACFFGKCPTVAGRDNWDRLLSLIMYLDWAQRPRANPWPKAPWPPAPFRSFAAPPEPAVRSAPCAWLRRKPPSSTAHAWSAQPRSAPCPPRSEVQCSSHRAAYNVRPTAGRLHGVPALVRAPQHAPCQSGPKRVAAPISLPFVKHMTTPI
jgi:hypothetical protein